MGEPVHDEREELRQRLLAPATLLQAWLQAFEASVMRLPQPVDLDSLRVQLEPVVRDLRNMASPDRQGRMSALHFRPGSAEVAELEKTVSFAAAQLGAQGWTGFDLGALLTALRDALCTPLRAELREELGRYLEWLLVLANDSLCHAREQAAYERFNQELDEALPMLMITPELPAAIFVCRPDTSSLAGHFGRLLLAVVRVGARAIIIDVQGLSREALSDFGQAFALFLGHRKISGRTTVVAHGVKDDDQDSWQRLCDAHHTGVVFEDSFEGCVRLALELGGWRLVPS